MHSYSHFQSLHIFIEYYRLYNIYTWLLPVKPFCVLFQQTIVACFAPYYTIYIQVTIACYTVLWFIQQTIEACIAPYCTIYTSDYCLLHRYVVYPTDDCGLYRPVLYNGGGSTVSGPLQGGGQYLYLCRDTLLMWNHRRTLHTCFCWWGIYFFNYRSYWSINLFHA